VTPDEARGAIERALARIAPEADLGGLDPRADLRETLDLDSMDFLNFVVGLHAETGIEVPESDYPELATLAGCIAYLAAGGRQGA
jgi:acyl carrier protein